LLKYRHYTHLEHFLLALRRERFPLVFGERFFNSLLRAVNDARSRAVHAGKSALDDRRRDVLLFPSRTGDARTFMQASSEDVVASDII